MTIPDVRHRPPVPTVWAVRLDVAHRGHWLLGPAEDEQAAADLMAADEALWRSGQWPFPLADRPADHPGFPHWGPCPDTRTVVCVARELFDAHSHRPRPTLDLMHLCDGACFDNLGAHLATILHGPTPAYEPRPAGLYPTTATWGQR